jgi:PAS domain S-box-containing protein
VKSLIVRRIIVLMTLAILISSVATGALGVFLSEDLISNIRGEEFVPNLSVLSECAKHYHEGSMTRATFESIVQNASENNTSQYIIYDSEKNVTYSTHDLSDHAMESKLSKAVEDVFKGRTIAYKAQIVSSQPIEIVGLPIIENGKVLGAVVLVTEMVDLLAIRNQYIQSLLIAIVIVLPLAVILAYFILKRIISPIKTITQMSLSILEGDFSVRADETLEGELGFLGRTMNVISANLYKSLSQLFIEKNRLHQVLNTLDEGMIAVDEDLKITHFNSVLLNRFGLKEDTILGKHIYEFEYLENELIELQSIITEKRQVIKTSHFGESILEIIIAPIEDEKNQNAGAVILFRDITEMVKLENLRKDYVANVSHELRSPLTSIRALIEPLMDSVVKDEADIQRYYQIIYQESLRLSRLVDDIMELSRLQAHEAVISKNMMDLNLIFEMVYERYRLVDESIQLIYTPKDLPLVYSNYDRIEQILVILLDNAYKFTPENGTIEIATEVKEDHIKVRVVDSGIGISKEDLPFVFQRFYKSDKSRTKKGTGLGLSIANEILAIMNESISVQSVLAKGSEFAFTVHFKESSI